MSSFLITLISNIRQQYVFYSNIFLLTSGVINNLFLILIFVTLRPFRGNQCTFLFTVESISNIGLFLSLLSSYFYSYITGNDPTILSLVWCKFQYAAVQIFGLCSLFTICFLTFDQFMTTNPRYSCRQFSTLKLAHRFTFFNVCFVVLHSIPFLILAESRPSNGCSIYNPALYSYLTYVYYPILSSFLPILVTMTFSLLAYRNVRRIVRRQLPVVRRRLDRQLTAMVLARVLCLILLGLPYIIYSLYRLNLDKTENNQLTLTIANFVGSIMHSLVYADFAINLYLFLIVSARFRRQAKSFIVKICCSFFSGLCYVRTHNRNNNQVVPETVQEVIFIVESV